jgi:hypothetical protein
MRFVILAVALMFFSSATAHEMTPAYLKLVPAEDGIYETTIKMLNRRKDVEFYEVSAFDDEWNPLPFGSYHRVFKLPYLKRTEVKVYFQKKTLNTLVYVCTTSKLFKTEGTAVSSRICSKVER